MKKHNRRHFIRTVGATGLSLSAAASAFGTNGMATHPLESFPMNNTTPPGRTSLIGDYGQWAADLVGEKAPTLSFRNKSFTSLDQWRGKARKAVQERMAIPALGGVPRVTLVKQHEYDGLHIEELSWQLPYGRPTSAIFLKPANAKGKLPGILAFHDHSGNKYLGTRKITRLADDDPAFVIDHQAHAYEGTAWANEVAKRGYAVLVPDAFPFGSRRVLLADVPEHLRDGLNDDDPENPENMDKYNRWAGQHEHIMAKSLFSAGTTWPGVFFAEDQKALDVLCARNDVDAANIGCAGLSGGGMRTAFMGGLDERIKCAVCVGFMTTWRDLILYKSYTHTWMTYVPVLPNELDFPEILALRVPLPTMVLNDTDDPLYTLEEMKRADAMIAEVYKKANAPDRYRCSFYPGPHKFDKAMQREAYAWFDKYLKKS